MPQTARGKKPNQSVERQLAKVARRLKGINKIGITTDGICEVNSARAKCLDKLIRQINKEKVIKFAKVPDPFAGASNIAAKHLKEFEKRYSKVDPVPLGEKEPTRRLISREQIERIVKKRGV